MRSTAAHRINTVIVPRRSAPVVQLLERTWIRVGNSEYTRANGSYGLTTFRESFGQQLEAA